jgi:hypothetical protein
LALSADESVLEPVAQQEPVRKIGKWVVQRLADKRGFSLEAVGHVVHCDNGP